MFIELHILQNFAPSNLNRDDTNQPKDTEFGGWRRARISSQALKRAMRLDPVFKATTGVEPSTRTRIVVRLLRERLMSATDKTAEEANPIVDAFAEAYAGEVERKEGKETRTKIALYLSPAEVNWAVAQLHARWDEVVTAVAQAKDKPKKAEGDKKAKKAKEEDSVLAQMAKDLAKQTKDRTTNAPDIALFGRMLTEHPDTDIDAACQVAHAISTHAIRMDTDFFTAVDDLQQKDETGAGMMGVVGFNSPCLYRYARLDWDKLLENLKGDKDLALKTVKAFLLASEAAIPSGKQNTFAAHNRPSFMLAVARTARSTGWSLANAFEAPVHPQNGSGLVAPSVTALDEYWQGLSGFYGETSVAAKAVAVEPRLKVELSASLQAARKATLDEWVQTMLDALTKGNAA